VQVQTYANHRHRATGWVITALLAVLGFVGIVLFVLRAPSVITISLLLLGSGVLGLVALIRLYAIRLQDRIIRLEMRLRLAALGREHDISRVSVR
jgi:hypothetical protein